MMSPFDRHKVDVAWNKKNNAWKSVNVNGVVNGVKVSNHYYFTASFLGDQRKIIFYKQTMCSGNIVLIILSFVRK